MNEMRLSGLTKFEYTPQFRSALVSKLLLAVT